MNWAIITWSRDVIHRYICSLTFLLLQISAKDGDFGDYGALTYDIVSDMAKEVFAVDGDSGQITTKVRLDRETKSVSGVMEAHSSREVVP